jgi:hypothetical protein
MTPCLHYYDFHNISNIVEKLKHLRTTKHFCGQNPRCRVAKRGMLKTTLKSIL